MLHAFLLHPHVLEAEAPLQPLTARLADVEKRRLTIKEEGKAAKAGRERIEAALKK